MNWSWAEEPFDLTQRLREMDVETDCEFLDLGKNAFIQQLSSEDVQLLRDKLPNLQVLNLYGCDLERLPFTIGLLRINSLYLRFNKRLQSLPPALQVMPLHKLYIEGTPVAAKLGRTRVELNAEGETQMRALRHELRQRQLFWPRNDVITFLLVIKHSPLWGNDMPLDVVKIIVYYILELEECSCPLVHHALQLQVAEGARDVLAGHRGQLALQLLQRAGQIQRRVHQTLDSLQVQLGALDGLLQMHGAGPQAVHARVQVDLLQHQVALHVGVLKGAQAHHLLALAQHQSLHVAAQGRRGSVLLAVAQPQHRAAVV